VVGLYYLRHPRMLVECLEEIVAKDVRTKGEYQLTDALQLMIDRGEQLQTFNVDGWYDCGKPETLLSTNKSLLLKNSTERSIEGVVIDGPVYIAPTAKLRNCVIGPFATVGDFAEITEAVVRDSIIGEHARVSRVLLDHSIVGNDSVVAGGFKRMNVGDSSEIESE
jgi:glucose-1-phosphate thymidylyltransferase